jgi:hypothetical protein
MQWIKKIASEIFGLFVDVGSFAAAILLWLGIVWGVRTLLPQDTIIRWAGPLLFAGLALILLENVLRSARRRVK